MRRLASLLTILVSGLWGAAALAAGPFTFVSIDGGTIDLGDWEGRPVLVVNTASRCGYTYQYDGLQGLYERYRDDGLVVLAVPSNDFRQELASEEEVKDFCEVNFNLDLPMTVITPVRGAKAHPFYAWVRETEGFEPSWKFNKILLDGEGAVAATFGAKTKPMSQRMTGAVEAVLPAS